MFFPAIKPHQLRLALRELAESGSLQGCRGKGWITPPSSALSKPLHPPRFGSLLLPPQQPPLWLWAAPGRCPSHGISLPMKSLLLLSPSCEGFPGAGWHLQPLLPRQHPPSSSHRARPPLHPASWNSLPTDLLSRAALPLLERLLDEKLMPSGHLHKRLPSAETRC